MAVANSGEYWCEQIAIEILERNARLKAMCPRHWDDQGDIERTALVVMAVQTENLTSHATDQRMRIDAYEVTVELRAAARQMDTEECDSIFGLIESLMANPPEGLDSVVKFLYLTITAQTSNERSEDSDTLTRSRARKFRFLATLKP